MVIKNNKRKTLFSILSLLLALLLLITACDKTPKNNSDLSTENDPPKVTTPGTTDKNGSTGDKHPNALKDVLDSISVSSNQYDVTNLHSCAALVYDKNKNEILYTNEDINAELFPASTTKLLTALYALSVAEPDLEIKVGYEQQLVAGDSSKAGINYGEAYSLEELIAFMIIPSGNDAAYAIAKGVGATMCRENCSTGEALSAFVMGMNEYAKNVLGLENTFFVTPDGYHDDSHVTTLLEMLKISVAASENPIIMKYAAMSQFSCKSSTNRTVTVYNTNSFISPGNAFYNKYVTGLKTGHTGTAGRCICVSYDDGENSYIVLVFRVKSEYGDAYSDSYYRNKNVHILLEYFTKNA